MPVFPPRESSANSPAGFSHIGGSNGNPGNGLGPGDLMNRRRDQYSVFVADSMAWLSADENRRVE
jgi:hypothetical protein